MLKAIHRRLHTSKFYIDGSWVAPRDGGWDGVVHRPSSTSMDITNPASGAAIGTLALGTFQDVDAAVAAARSASDSWRATTKATRLELMKRLASLYESRAAEMADAISSEMGAPRSLARTAQAAAGLSHLKTFISVLDAFEFEDFSTLGAKEALLWEPLGVCACITPWNWPMNQVMLKVVPALAAGNTVVLKPSEIAPLSSLLFAELIDAAGFPKGRAADDL
jgi:aldehyde dehydrogenase (NAD+)